MDRPKDSAKIRTLNDAFRTTFTGGRVIVTVGVNGLSKELLIHVIGNVRAFNVFMADNDLHGEHDFESFEVGGDKFLWKIDYNDTSPEFGSPDPRLACALISRVYTNLACQSPQWHRSTRNRMNSWMHRVPSWLPTAIWPWYRTWVVLAS